MNPFSSREEMRKAKRRAASLGVLLFIGILTIGGVGARGVYEGATVLGIDLAAPSPSIAPSAVPSLSAEALAATCQSDVQRAWDDYLAAYKEWGQANPNSTDAELAAFLVTIEQRLIAAVEAIPCPASVDEAKTTFLSVDAEYVAFLEKVANGGSFRTNEFRVIDYRADQAWDDLRAAAGVE